MSELGVRKPVEEVLTPDEQRWLQLRFMAKDIFMGVIVLIFAVGSTYWCTLVIASVEAAASWLWVFGTFLSALLVLVLVPAAQAIPRSRSPE